MIKKLTKRNASIQKNTAVAFTTKEKLNSRLGKDMKKNWILYVMILPVVIYYVVFAYGPLYGIQLAFKDYIIKDGIWGSPWVGFEHFTRFFSSYNFELLLKNTIGISLYSILVGFPIPIMFALLLNYLKNKHLKKTIQMASYAPYFISTVVMCGMIVIFLNPDTGIFNTIRGWLGLESIDFLGKPELFKSIYVWTGVWQGLGWSSIIYISALSGVDYQLHEAAIVDGATKLQRIFHVDLPSIKPTIVMLLILQMGSLMSVGFEKVFLLQNTLNKGAASVISTYVYEVGLINSDYGYSTAIGLFNSVINLTLIVVANQICKKFADESLF
ncbi:ABC transporter permease [Robinsoniella peoriensis]|uniref:ABC transporter permease n=1 Tax=Robinsoniella peoriensis TaxID=180332 RepID=UPI003753048A